MRVFDYGKAYDQKLISMNPFGKGSYLQAYTPIESGCSYLLCLPEGAPWPWREEGADLCIETFINLLLFHKIILYLIGNGSFFKQEFTVPYTCRNICPFTDSLKFIFCIQNNKVCGLTGFNAV